jgi:hypothetical protein
LAQINISCTAASEKIKKEPSIGTNQSGINFNIEQGNFRISCNPSVSTVLKLGAMEKLHFVLMKQFGQFMFCYRYENLWKH